jgi:putative ABC transport system permease protein
VPPTRPIYFEPAMKIPLAWRTLTHNKRRLCLSLAGIGFVVLLMFMEVGFENGALDTELIVYRNFNADLVMISTARTPDYPQRFPRSRLSQANSCPAVSTVIPLYIQAAATWRVPGTGALRTIRVIGFDARTAALLVPRPVDQVLRQPGTALFDTRARDVYGRPTTGTVAEVGGRTVRIGGLFSMGIDLEADGNLLMDESTYFAVFGDASGGADPASVDFGLIQLKAGSDVQQALRQIRKDMGEDVRIMTLDDYVAFHKKYWQERTPVGFLFQMGVFVGLMIGVIVCYQILFTEISANLLPFATLKGMGYRNSYLIKVVLHQAAFLAIMGFLCGLIAAVLLYRFLEWGTGLVMLLTALRAANILILTLVMCLIAGVMAVGKVIKADPADCF